MPRDQASRAGYAPNSLLPGVTLSFPAGGGDIDLAAHTKIRDGEIPALGQLEWKSGSLGIVDSGAGFNVDGTFQIRSGGIQNVQSGASLHVKSGATLDCENGSIADFLGQTFFTDAGGGGTNGQVFFGDFFGGIATVAFIENGTTCTFFDNTFLKFQGTSGNLALAEWKNFSKAQFDSGAVLSLLSGASMTLASGSTSSDGSTRTRTGPETLSGNGALTKKRIFPVPAHGLISGSDPLVTIDASRFDVGELPNDLSNLGSPGAQPLNLTITENVAYAGHTFTLRQTFSDPTQLVLVAGSASGSVAKFNSVASSPAETGSVELYYDSAGHVQVLNVWAGSDSAHPLAEQG